MKILIADDHALVLDALASKLDKLRPQTQIVLAESIARLREYDGGDIDVAIVDLLMPGASGHQHISELRTRFPQLPVIVLSACEDARTVRQLLEEGVRGFVSKSDNAAILIAAIELVLSGGTYIPPLALQTRADKSENPSPAAEAPLLNLTQRQEEVLHLLAQGYPNKLIARILDIGEGTVKIHVAAILRTLGVRNRTEAVGLLGRKSSE